MSLLSMKSSILSRHPMHRNIARRRWKWIWVKPTLGLNGTLLKRYYRDWGSIIYWSLGWCNASNLLHTLFSLMVLLEEEFDRVEESVKEINSHHTYSFCIVRCYRDYVTEPKKKEKWRTLKSQEEVPLLTISYLRMILCSSSKQTRQAVQHWNLYSRGTKRLLDKQSMQRSQWSPSQERHRQL